MFFIPFTVTGFPSGSICLLLKTCLSVYICRWTLKSRSPFFLMFQSGYFLLPYLLVCYLYFTYYVYSCRIFFWYFLRKRFHFCGEILPCFTYFFNHNNYKYFRCDLIITMSIYPVSICVWFQSFFLFFMCLICFDWVVNTV